MNKHPPAPLTPQLITAMVDLNEQPLAQRKPRRYIVDPTSLDLFDVHIAEPALRYVWRTRRPFQTGG